MKQQTITDRVLRAQVHQDRKKAIIVEKAAAKVRREKREKEENEMWKAVAEFFACDGTCPICSRENIPQITKTKKFATACKTETHATKEEK